MAMNRKLESPLTKFGDGRGLLAAWRVGGEPTIVLRTADMAGMQEVIAVSHWERKYC